MAFLLMAIQKEKERFREIKKTCAGFADEGSQPRGDINAVVA
jgi:hypothetical protein